MTDYWNPDDHPVVPGPVIRNPEARLKLALVYPPPKYPLREPVEALVVNAGEATSVQIELGASVSYIQQPEPVTKILDPEIVPLASCYTIVNGDGLPVDPKEWREYGGRVTVEINPDTVTATVTMYGPSLPALSPFSLGQSEESQTYGTLYLLGTGVTADRKLLRIDTGLDEDEAADDSTASLDNPYMQTVEQAWDAAHGALVRRLGEWQRCTLSLSGVDGVEGMDAQYPESALGRLAGARIVFDGAYYRIRSATISSAGIEATCEQDTTFDDFDAALPDGLTYAQFDALHAGQRFLDFNADPLAGGTLG